ncbi:nucleoporin-interacting protein [Halobacillus litoralis]|uniref:nucleoporin-interacting protein n=1 Tax=Halobacillus litoralis TaxID=45668 RepID=UPI001CFC80BB|nr:nucleoporin-interacting protein [Halobacillus litoralis]
MKKGLDDSNNTFKIIAWAMFLVFVSCTLYFRLADGSEWARSWDQVDFALGVKQYDLFSMQPHFPGYPYFILGGMIVHKWVQDPVYALSVFNTILTLSSLVPIFLLFKRRFPVLQALLFTSVIHSMGYLWVMSTEAMSEASALSVLWWYIWSLYQADRSSALRWRILPLLVFSILMGVRLSYLPFGLGILWLWWRERRAFQTKKSYVQYVLSKAGIAAAFQFIWVVGLVLSTGSTSTFIELAFGFAAGHFTEWGGAVTADSMPLWERVALLLFYNLIWTALSARSWIILGLYALLTLLVIFQFSKTKLRKDAFLQGILLLCTAYFLWALFAQNVDKPRHILPLSGLFVYLLLHIYADRAKVYIIGVCLSLVIVQTWVGQGLAEEKAENPPAVYQLTQYISELNGQKVVYTWEESRVMSYLQVDYTHKKILTYDYFQSELSYNKDKRVLLTDHVVKGFENQGYDLQGRVRKIAEFSSSNLFDPVYGKIELYEWTWK